MTDCLYYCNHRNCTEGRKCQHPAESNGPLGKGLSIGEVGWGVVDQHGDHHDDGEDWHDDVAGHQPPDPRATPLFTEHLLSTIVQIGGTCCVLNNIVDITDPVS